ncbi:helix-turn-helix domain-containing protein [Amycolatopsis sp. NPDC088138]|uniref:helix-turn-helix domain-containing protein n=1 Tax=Amycolatopsis sp. NPDC088138 TaxID=3363938 RepID=UPI003802282E
MAAFERKNPAGEVEVIVRENLIKLRKAAGWTLAELADRSGLPVVSVSRIEAGNRRITVDDLVVMASLFEIDPANLLVPLKIEHKIHVEVDRTFLSAAESIDRMVTKLDRLDSSGKGA